jgi:hypothetical protein
MYSIVCHCCMETCRNGCIFRRLLFLSQKEVSVPCVNMRSFVSRLRAQATPITARLERQLLLHISCAESIRYRMQAYKFLVKFVIHKTKNSKRQDNNWDGRVAFAS